MALCAGLFALRAFAQQVAPPELPVAPYKKNDKGIIVARVTFAADGTVKDCRVVRSNAPYPLEAATVDQIKRKWINDWFAGQTIDFPITFDEMPWYVTHWNDGLVPPPNTLPPGDPGRKLKLRITFDADGWVEQVKIAQASGIEVVDIVTANWVKAHWHNDAFAGQTLDAPFVFKTPPGPKPVTAKAPPRPKPKPAEPAWPTEPIAPPAVRVQ
jgi:hypothetical protein